MTRRLGNNSRSPFPVHSEAIPLAGEFGRAKLGGNVLVSRTRSSNDLTYDSPCMKLDVCGSIGRTQCLQLSIRLGPEDCRLDEYATESGFMMAACRKQLGEKLSPSFLGIPQTIGNWNPRQLGTYFGDSFLNLMRLQFRLLGGWVREP